MDRWGVSLIASSFTSKLFFPHRHHFGASCWRELPPLRNWANNDWYVRISFFPFPHMYYCCTMCRVPKDLTPLILKLYQLFEPKKYVCQYFVPILSSPILLDPVPANAKLFWNGYCLINSDIWNVARSVHMLDNHNSRKIVNRENSYDISI